MLVPILGATGSGKTEVARRLIRNATSYQIVIIDDPNSQWTSEKLRRSGYVYFEPAIVRNLEELRRGNHRSKIVRLVGWLPDDVVAAMDWARRFHAGRDTESRTPDVAFVLDEVFRLCSPKRGWIGGERGPFWDVMLNHRHMGMAIYACAQSPKIIDRRLVDNAEQSYLCRCQAVRDLDWIADTYGDEYRSEVESLPSAWPLQTVIQRPGRPPQKIYISKI